MDQGQAVEALTPKTAVGMIRVGTCRGGSGGGKVNG